ncbi:MAG: tetratricopeptide repeat protein [Alphaproteobacteria bacterium]
MNKAAIFRLLAVLLAVFLAGGCAGGDPPPDPPPGAPPKVVLPILAGRGDAEAQVSLGWMYQIGQGFERDYNQAAYWYRAAADQGNGLAQYSLGELYARGLGVAQNFAQAAAWHRRAAEGGNVSAQFRLAYFHEHGLGVPRDYIAAAAWYDRAARGAQSAAGLPPSLVRLLGGGITPPALVQPARQATEIAIAVPATDQAPSGEAAGASDATADGHWVHIASFRTRAAAALHWDTLGERNGDILAGLRGRLLAHDLGDDGTWIRLFAGPLDHAAAANLCEILRSRAIYCAVSAGF